MTVQAIKAGAMEFLSKRFRDQELLDAIEQALEHARMAWHQRVERAALRQCYDMLPPG